MTEQILSSPAEFSHTTLPVVKKTVFRMGVAGSYGIDSTDIRWAAEHGANYWVWGRGFGKVTEGIREVIKHNREGHVVAMLGWGFFGRQVRRSVENALQTLGTDYLDVFKLGWLGIIMPPRPSGESFNGPPLSPELCYRFVLTNPNVHVVLTGPQNREQLSRNLAAMKQGPLEPDELDWIRQYGQLVKARKRLDYVK